MPRTQSEQLFEQFCARKRIPFKRVAVGPNRTPDYDVFLPRRKVVVEVKEITPNAEEKAAEVAARMGQYAVVSLTPGERIRRKIGDASAQIKARTRRRYPGMLVLYEDGLLPRHIDSYQVRVAMYGLETIVFAVPASPRAAPYPIARRYGPRRKMTPTDNKTISAIALLSSAHHGPVELTVFHNTHANVPLPSSLLRRYGVRQYKLAEAQLGTIANWEEVAGEQTAP
jgi:hypothetical protein